MFTEELARPAAIPGASDSPGPAVVFSIDDIHPSGSSQGIEAGGDLERGVLGRVRSLLHAHPRLRVTLFVTADWRAWTSFPTRRALARLPLVRERVYLCRRLAAGTMRLDRHPEFCRFLLALPRTEVAAHGLDHVGLGPEPAREFARKRGQRLERDLDRMEEIFAAAGFGRPAGIAPPGWAVPPALLDELERRGFRYVQGGRDLETPVAPGATGRGSGLAGLPLFAPARLPGRRLVHVPSNWSATSDRNRCRRVLDSGGLLSIKAHAIKQGRGHVALDGLDEAYRARLDGLFGMVEAEYGRDVRWLTMAEAAGGERR